MNLFALSGILAAISSIAMALLMFSRGKTKSHYLWGVFSLTVMLWGFGGYWIAVTQDVSRSIFWWKIAYAGVIFIPVLFIHFVHTFLEIKRKWLILAVYFSGYIFLYANLFTDWFIRDVRFVFDQFYYISPPTVLYNIFFIFFVSLVVYGHVELLKAYRQSQGMKKFQIKYFFIATSIGFGGGSFSYLPVYYIDIYPSLNLTVCLFAPIIGYAILRYRLMDIRFAFRKIFIYVGGTALTYAGFYGVIWTYVEFFGGTNTRNAYLAGLIVGPIFVFVFYRFDKFLNRFANKYLFASLYNTEKTIRELSQQLNTYNDLNKIVSVIINTIKKTMQLDRAGVLLVDFSTQPIRYQIAKVIGFDRTNGISLVQDNFLTRYLEKTQKPLVRDELHLLSRDSVNKKDQESLIKLQEHMVKIEAFLCLPLTSNRKLIGIIVLGSKISGDAYTKEDLELLETLSNQASVAIENARLYKEVADFNKTLREKVDEQTHSLQEKAEHLTKLLEMRSEFLDIASHQLKTPVSVILGTLSMFKEGSIQKLPKAQQDKFIDNIFNKAKKLGTIINDILRASEMDTDQFQLVQDNIKLVSLADLAKVVCEDLKPEAMEKKINLNCSVEGKNNTQIMADADFLNHAISNLVDNAIKYTAKGGVEVKVFEENSRVFLSVKDSGIGIPKADAKKIFEKFNRATNAVDMYTDGSGLGLFIVKKIVEAHAGGQVGFESIEGEGTTFTISFPVIAKVKARNVIK